MASRNTDTRMIEMQFENREFEKNIAKSTKSVEDLKSAMNFDETSKGVSKISDIFGKLDFSKLETNIQKLTDKFTGLGTMSELIVSQVRRHIESAAAKLSGFIDSMTTAQVSAGMSKYEMLNKSVQTIKAATGKEESEVYDVLQRLNDYTDMTSYNFSDMASNIGKFTSVGIDLRDAERQMEGIANWAARSGAGIQEASRAMYNLSQAMGVGKMTTIDWKSIENAGMATKEFKEQMIQAGLAAGTLERDSNGVIKTAKSLGKQVEVSFQNIRETFNKGWANREVLSGTLEKYYFEDLKYEGEELGKELSKDQKKLFESIFNSSTSITQDAWKKLGENSSESLDKSTKSASKYRKEIMAANEANERFGRGTIDLNKRKVVQNKDGTISTELSFSTNIDGKEVLLPTVIDGKIVNEEEAIKHFQETGEHLGMFDTVKEAEEYAKELHNLQDEYYNNNKSFDGIKDLTEALGNEALVTEKTKQAAIDAGIAQGTLVKVGEKDGKAIYKTSQKLGKSVEFTLDTFEKSLSSKWLTKDVANMVWGFDTLAKESYMAAQKCLTFSDVIGAWKDQISTGWMNSFKIILGELSESMEFFSNVCNRVGDGIGKLIDIRNGALQSWSENGGRNTLVGIILGDYGQDASTGAFGFLDMLEGAGKMVMEGIGDFLGLFGDEFDRKMIKEDPEYLKGFIGRMLNGVTDGISDFLKKIRDFFNASVDVNGKSKTRLEVIQDVISGIAGALKLGYDILTKAIGFIGMIGQDLSPGMDALLGFFGDLGTSIFNTSKEAGETNSISKWFQDLRVTVAPLTESINNLLTSLSNLLRIIFGLDKEGATQTGVLKTIGSVINTIANIITKVASPVINFISKLIDLVGGLFKNGVNPDSLKEFGQGIGDAFGGMMNSLADALPKKLSFITDWVHGIFGGGKKAVEGESKSLFGVLGDAINKTKDTTNKAEGEAKGQQSSGGAGLMGLLTGSNVAVWVGVAALVSVILLIRKAKKVLGSIKDFFGNLGDTLKDGIKIKYQDESFATKFLKIGAAIALVAACIYVLGSMPLGSLIQGGIAVAVIFGLMFGMFKLLEKSAKDGSFTDQLGFAAQVTALAFGMIALGVAVGIMALALKPFTKMSWEQYGKAMAGLGGILLQMVAFMLLLKTFKIETTKIAGFAGFAFSLGILVKAIQPFANMTWEQYAKAMAGLGGVLLEIIAFMLLIKLTGVSTLSLNMKGIIKFALGIAVLILAIQPFANMSWEQYAKVMAGLGGVLIEIIAFMVLIKASGVSVYSLNMKGILKFVLGIAVLILAIQPFANMSWEQYAKVMAGLGGVLLEIIAFMFLIKAAGVSVYSLNMKGILMFAIGLMLLIKAIMPFKDMTWEQYAKTMAGLGGVLLELIAFMGLMKLIGTNDANVANILGLAYGIGALVNAITPFKDMTWEQYAKAMAGLAGVLLIMLGFMALMKLVKPSIKNMLQMAIFAAVLTVVKDIDWKVIAAFSAGLSVLVVALSVAAALAMVIGIKGFVVLAAGIILVLGAIAIIAPLLIGNVMSAVRNAAGDLAIIGDLMATFSNKMNGVGESGFDKAGKLFDKMVEIVGKLAGFMFTSGNTFAFMNGMSRLTLAADEMIKFDNRIKTLSEDGGSGKALSIIGTYESIFVDHLSKFAEYIGYSTFFYDAMFKLGSAFDYFDSMTNKIVAADDNQGLQLIKQLAACAPDLDTIYKMDLDKFKTQLAELGGAMTIYAKGAASVNEGEITDDTDVGGAIILLQKISSSLSEAGGFSIPTNMPTDSQLTDFGVQLAALAGALVAFEEAGKGLGDGTAKAIETLDFFYDLKTKLQENANFGSDLTSAIDSFKGEGGKTLQASALTLFGEDIAELGSAMSHFAASTQIIDKETNEVTPIDFSLATGALESIASLGEKLPRMGGALSIVMGRKQTLDELATQINLLGTSINEFHTSTTEFDTANNTSKPMDFTNVIEFMNSVGDLQNKLPKVKDFSIESLFESHEMTFGELASQLVQLGSGLNIMSSSISGKDDSGKPNFDEEAAMSAIRVLESGIVPFMTSLSTQLPSVGGLGKFISTVFNGREANLTDIGTQLAGLSDGLGQFGDKIQGKFKNADDVNNAITAIDGIISLMVHLSEGSNLAKSGSIEDYAHGLNTFLQAFLGGIKDAEGNQDYYAGLEAIVEIMEWVSKELDNTPGISVENLQKFSLLAEALGHIASIDLKNVDNFKNVGKSIATGIATGITENTSVVTKAAVDLATQTYEATMKALDAASPSKVFTRVGSYVGLGMAKGIENSGEEAVDAATGMTEDAIESASTIMSLISRIMAEDTNASPTISPVLDLTNLNEGMNAFKESLNGNGYSVNFDTSGVLNGAGRLGPYGYSYESAKPDYSGIYDRMNALSKQMEDMTKTISNMKIVMNTGALVGALSDGIDEDIGTKSFYASRNN